jgi:MtN3 and saliva related transmembrane protein
MNLSAKKIVVGIVEFCFSTALFINAILFVPQAIELFKTKNANNLSLTTFLGFNLIQVAIILHGIFKKDWLLVTGMCLSLVSCGTVSFLIFLYH